MNRRPIYLSLMAALLGSVAPLHAQHDESDDGAEGHHHEAELEKMTVTASPLQTNPLEMTQSAEVLYGEELEKQLQSSIGETLKNLPGIANASFGASVGRPVIRGLDASRVGVLENNVSSNDISDLSQDHAVTIEPFLADTIEVLKGPATLLYGSDTIGGVVNVRTNRIPQAPVDGTTGRAMIQGDTVADERYGAGRLDWGKDGWAMHADAFWRDRDDYEIPGFAEVDPEPGEEPPGELPNSFQETSGGALGGTLFGESWSLGGSVSLYDANYGIPGAGHAHEDEVEEHGGEEHDEEEEEAVSIDIESVRYDAEWGWSNPFAGFENWKLLLNRTDYEHTEFEGEEVGTVFENDTTDGRLELTHLPIAGTWRGSLGVQYSDRDFSAVGDEAFVPPSQTDTLAVFLLEEAEFGDWRVEFGGRLEDQEVTASDGRGADHDPMSLSAGTSWAFTERDRLALNLTRAERAPGAEELLAFGPHIATQTFEVGDLGLQEETANTAELSWRRHQGPVTFTLTAYHNDFDDYIYLADTGLEEDGLPLRQWTQQDAEFTGFEAGIEWDLGARDSGHWVVTALFDTVDAELSDGSNVPRIPPQRFGLGLDWDHRNWAVGMDWMHVSSQDDVAPFETPTDSYQDVGFDIVYLVPTTRYDWEFYLRGRNLLDEEIRNHASFLKDFAPQPGRNFIVGARVRF